MLPREITIPSSEIFELDALSVAYCEKPAGMGAYRESQLPEEERQARDAAFDQARAYAVGRACTSSGSVRNSRANTSVVNISF